MSRGAGNAARSTVVHTLEYHGRLCRVDRRPANPRSYDLLFRLHAGAEGKETASMWEETQPEVEVAAGGFYSVILGRLSPLRAQLFAEVPRFLSVSILREGHAPEEAGVRVPLLGSLVRLSESLGHMDGRLGQVERRKGGDRRNDESPLEAANGDGVAARRIRILHKRLRRLENGGGVVGLLINRLTALEGRVVRLDGEDGRIPRLEDELEDLVGPDGDVVDLTERMDILEGVSPEGLRMVHPGPASTLDTAALETRIDALAHRVMDLEQALLSMAPTPGPSDAKPRARTRRPS